MFAQAIDDMVRTVVAFIIFLVVVIGGLIWLVISISNSDPIPRKCIAPLRAENTYLDVVCTEYEGKRCVEEKVYIIDHANCPNFTEEYKDIIVGKSVEKSL